MKFTSLAAWILLCFSLARAGDDFYFWNYLSHPYQTYYLEDYCGPVGKTDCSSEAQTVYLNSTGSGSAVVVRGFRRSKPRIENSVKCCITMRTVDSSQFNVQLDEVYLKQKKTGERCGNFLRFYGLGEELGHVCSEVEKYSFKTPNNVLGMEYVLDTENAPEFQKIKVVVTSATDTNRMRGARCSAAKEQWQCDNQSCIWQGFRCDAHNNCGDWSDELYCGVFSTYWTIFIGIACGIFVALLIWCVCRCCCCCCCFRKKSRTPQNAGPFLYVTSLGPSGRPVPQEKLYPSLEHPYQNAPSSSNAPFSQRDAPPAYSENAFLSPAYNPSYGTNTKS